MTNIWSYTRWAPTGKKCRPHTFIPGAAFLLIQTTDLYTKSKLHSVLFQRPVGSSPLSDLPPRIDVRRALAARHRVSARRRVFSPGVEEIVDPAPKDPGQAEGQRQGRVERAAFDGDDRLAGDSQLIGKALL